MKPHHLLIKIYNRIRIVAKSSFTADAKATQTISEQPKSVSMPAEATSQAQVFQRFALVFIYGMK